MSDGYEELVEHAEILVNIIHKKYITGNKMAYFALFSGIGNCKVENSSIGVHNYQAVIDAIHNYCSSADIVQIKQGYQDGIDAMIRVSTHFSTLQDLIHILFYELKKEQEEDTKIKIDADAIVSKINKKIHQNYDEYKKENAGFEVWLEQNCKYALDNFSLSIF